jgi:hypothetical protein
MHTTIEGGGAEINISSVNEFLMNLPKKLFYYEVIAGNNPRVIERVIDQTFRAKFWRNIRNPLEVQNGGDKV